MCISSHLMAHIWGSIRVTLESHYPRIICVLGEVYGQYLLISANNCPISGANMC